MKLWSGIFMYSNEIIKKHTHAPTIKSAKMRMIHQLAKEHDVHPSHVYAIFDGSKDNYIIEEVKE